MYQKTLTCDKVLYGGNQWFAVFRCCNILQRAHQLPRFRFRLISLGKMQVHLIAIKISIEWIAQALIKSQSSVMSPI